MRFPIYFLEGKKIHNLTVIKRVKGLYLCKCDCGIDVYYSASHLNKGRYKSCGCLSNPFNINYLTNFKDSFWNRTEKKDNGCIIWKGNKRNGYGRVGYKNKLISCHRLVWEWQNGKIPEKQLICHKCDNPSCVNHEHLFLGTHMQNMEDCKKKGRSPNNKGENNPNSKLTSSQIDCIRELRKKMKRFEIANIFSVSPETITRICKNH